MQQDKNQDKSEAAKREEEILKFWASDKTFQKSLDKKAPKGNYVFYDGPPFATGTPHYGHILGSTAKDVIGRYKTMQGYHVPRRWGWDCHGLPIENIVEKDLKISGRKAIEEYGIEKFTEHARSKVLTYVAEWRKTIDRMGRWVDFDNSYKTMDNSFIESVWWALGELNKKGLIYEGVRVLAYCPRCETPIANSEIAMDNSYKDITDISITTQFELVDSPQTFVLAWTTTPWTTPGNVALAVGADIDYAEVEGEVPGNKYILAKDRVEANFKTAHKILRVFKGTELIGKSYKPLFDYYAKDKNLKNRENGWKIYGADFVTLDQGTGVVHIAPAFGEDDKRLGDEKSLPLVIHVDATGHFKLEVTDFAGKPVKPKEDPQSGDVLVIKYLAHAGLLFSKEKIVHSYPHCYRCETPLYYYALPSWFVNIQKEKEHILKRAESMSWVPAHLKGGRFKGGVESAPDWTISRNRYWASPLPIWKSKSGKVMFVHSLEDLKKKTKKSGNTYLTMRHGQAESNVQDISNSDVSGVRLTKAGKETARVSAEGLEGQHIDLIISSDIERARQTAEIVAATIGYDKTKIRYDQRLRELDFGGLNNKPMDEYLTAFPAEGTGFIDAPQDGESRLQVKRRVMEVLYELERTEQGKSILIVSHGDPIWLMRAGVQGLTVEEIIETRPPYPETGKVVQLDFVPLPHNANYELDFHRPYIDTITLVDEVGEEYARISEVVDCWFESGSMPFAQDHYPFERPNWQKENFPAGFVAEYIPQTRTWFYYTHAISTILFDHAPFEHVVTTGSVLAEDGQKMSKSKGNSPDPMIAFNKYGADAVRLYLMSGPLMKGEDMNFLDKGLDDLNKKVLMRLNNVLSFYKLYAPEKLDIGCPKSENVLDQWILARLEQFVSETTGYMETYELDRASRPIFDFVDDLSTWYLRRSRDRFKSDDVADREAAIATTHYVLDTAAKVIAPLTPFIAEHIYKELGNTESVHLAAWPTVEGLTSNSGLLEQMVQVRKVASLGLDARAKEKIAVRRPLAKLEVKDTALEGKQELLDLIKDEVNVKEIQFNKNLESEVVLDTKLTEELKQEGELRELMRTVQDLRKEKGLQPNDTIRLTLPESQKNLVAKYSAELKKTVKAETILFDAELALEVI